MKNQIKIPAVFILLSLAFTGCINTGMSARAYSEHEIFYRAGNSGKIVIEEGSLEVEGRIYRIKSSCPGEKSFKDFKEFGEIGGLVIEFHEPEMSALLGAYDMFEPDGSFAFLNIKGRTYLGENLKVRAKESCLINGDIVFVISGEMHGINNIETIKAEFKITESQLGGGDSRIDVKEGRAYLGGTLGTMTYNQIIDLMAKHPDVKTIVETHVDGSINDEVNMKTGHLLRDNKFNTEVLENGHIASGGVDLFLSGVKRTIGKGAKVGVHSWGVPEGETGIDFPEDHEVHDQQKAYHKKMLGDPSGIEFYFYTLKAAPADGIHYMTRDEIRNWGLETR